MRKRDELTNPNSCMSRAKDNEMTFVLLGRDSAAPKTIKFWCRERIRIGKNKPNDPQILEALRCAEEMHKNDLLTCDTCETGFGEGTSLKDGDPCPACQKEFKDGKVHHPW